MTVVGSQRDHHRDWKPLVASVFKPRNKPKVAIVALMRKIITTLNAMIRDNVAWNVRSA